MPDIRLVQNVEFPNHPHYAVTIDWSLLDNGTLDDTQALATAVIVALGTDSLAAVDDILPDPDSTDRAGWWGDLDAQEIWGGWPIGCKLWLLKRSKITGAAALQGATVIVVEQYIRDALQPFLNLNIASGIEVQAERTGRDKIVALVRLYRGPNLMIELRYQILWQGLVEQDTSFPEQFWR